MAKQQGKVTINIEKCRAIAESITQQGEEYTQPKPQMRFSWGTFMLGAHSMAKALAQQGILTDEQVKRLGRDVVRAVMKGKGSDSHGQAAG